MELAEKEAVCEKIDISSIERKVKEEGTAKTEDEKGVNWLIMFAEFLHGLKVNPAVQSVE